MTARIVIYPTPDLLAAGTAARLITTLVDIQATGGIPGIALTGGGVGTKMLVAINESSARDAVDWSKVDIFWGDERFVPSADPDRNSRQARDALLDHIPVDPARVHVMAASDGEFGADVDAAAAAYAEVIAGREPLDLVMLGMGDEGHVASIFPTSPAVYDTRPVVAVRDCPKPPPTRISLTLPTIRQAAEVWIITAAASKADAVATALGGAAEADLPAAGATGRSRTLWLLDAESASALSPAAAGR
ncbi:MAG: 6-phosphogluconolactonase [Nakamurella sp.]